MLKAEFQFCDKTRQGKVPDLFIYLPAKDFVVCNV